LKKQSSTVDDDAYDGDDFDCDSDKEKKAEMAWIGTVHNKADVSTKE
jgi:hypothetical protein